MCEFFTVYRQEFPFLVSSTAALPDTVLLCSLVLREHEKKRLVGLGLHVLHL